MTDQINGAAEDPAEAFNALHDIPQKQLVHVVNAGFTERFMGGRRQRAAGGGWEWVNARSGITESEPFEVAGNDAVMLDALRRFCGLPENALIWSLEGRGNMVQCVIGRPIGEQLTLQSDVQRMAACATPEIGASIAIAMLHVTGFNFREARQQLYDDAPRINLDH